MTDDDRKTLDQLERLLGRPFAADIGSCPSFDHLSEPQLGELEGLARSAGMIPAILYLRLLIAPRPSLRNASSFVEVVARQGLPMSEWFDHHHHRD